MSAQPVWRQILNARFWLHRRVHLVLIVWAVIYLPALGSLEIRGEEGRRILPGVSMLESNNYLVPQVGGKPYFRKPPLLNWVTAACFKVSGIRNEWTARLPSAIAILLVALALVRGAASVLGRTGSTFAALFWLTNAGNIEKGRLIEIEAIYVSLTGLAFVFWATAYFSGKSGGQLWFLPALFLGLGMLAKGPLPHLLFFYGPVIALLWNDRRLSLLLTRQHFSALLLMFGIIALWALPAYLLSESTHVARVWSRQFSGRLSGQNFNFGSWIINIARSFVSFLPWLPLGLVQFDAASEVRRRNRALLVGIAIPYAIVILTPEALPRFVMPALGPAAWWFGELLSQENLSWPGWLSARPLSARLRNQIVLVVTAAVAIGVLGYASAVVPRLGQKEKVKVHARQINAVVPPDVPLYAINPNYQPYLFYVRAPVRYVSSIDELPPDTKFFLVQPGEEAEAETTTHFAPARPQLVLRIKDYRNHEVVLFTVQPH